MIHPEQVVGRGTKAVRSNRLVRVPLGYGQLLPVHHEAGKKKKRQPGLMERVLMLQSGPLDLEITNP